MSSIDNSKIDSQSDLGTGSSPTANLIGSGPIALIEGSEYTEVNNAISGYNTAYIEYQNNPTSENAQKLTEQAKLLTELLEQLAERPEELVEPLTVDLLGNIFLNFKRSLVDLVFEYRPEDSFDKNELLESKHILIEFLPDLILSKAIYGILEGMEEQRAENLRQFEELARGVSSDPNHPSMFSLFDNANNSEFEQSS